MSSQYSLRLEEIILRAANRKKELFNVVGSQSTAAISFLLSQHFTTHFNGLPTLVVVSSFDDAELFAKQMSFFSNEFRCHILKQFDVKPYSGL